MFCTTIVLRGFMSMLVTQVRLPIKLSKEIDSLVRTGLYETRSDVVRDAVRRLIFEKQMHSLDIKGNSVKEIRKIRNELSKEPVDLDEINSLE